MVYCNPYIKLVSITPYIYSVHNQGQLVTAHVVWSPRDLKSPSLPNQETLDGCNSQHPRPVEVVTSSHTKQGCKS